jgi:hypothetical protein
MSATPYNIWQVPAYIPFIHPTLTDEAIAEAERKIGFPLPSSYIEMLKVQNGGNIRYTLEDYYHRQIYGIGSGDYSITSHTMWDEIRGEVSIDVDRLIPFDGDGLYWNLCLDYRENSLVPAVCDYNMVDGYVDEIASSFDEYIRMLIFAEEFNFYIPKVENLEHLLHLLSASLFLDFRACPQHIFGYSSHMAYKKRKLCETIKIEPNLIPRGFIDQGNQNFEVLKNALPGVTSLVNEIPESSYLLTVTPGLQSSLIAICEKQSIDLRPLSGFSEPWYTY